MKACFFSWARENEHVQVCTLFQLSKHQFVTTVHLPNQDSPPTPTQFKIHKHHHQLFFIFKYIKIESEWSTYSPRYDLLGVETR